MRRECDVETKDDFLRYYDGGWIGFGDNPVRPLLVRGPLTGEKLGFYRLTVDLGTEAFNCEWEHLKSRAQFGTPVVGMVPTNGEVVFGATLAVRNSSRGLRLDKVRYHTFNRWHLRNKLGEYFQIGRNNYDVIWRVFNPKYTSVSEAFTLLQSGETVGEALAPNLAAYTVPDAACPLLAYKRWTIGYIPSPNEVVLGEQYQDYQEDIQDIFGNNARVRIY